MPHLQGPHGAIVTATVLLLFNWGGQARAEVTLQDVIENVRRNESLYDNLDVTMHYEYKLAGRRFPKLEDGSVAAETHLTTHYVRQDGMFRLDDEGGSATADGQRMEDRVRAFDGELTRLYEQNSIGNIMTGRFDDHMRIDPHMLVLRPMLETHVPLSMFLSGADAVRAHPLNTLPGGLRLVSSYQGQVDFDGLHCHDVWILMTDASEEPIHRHEMLLAEDRNYLPVRMFSYTFKWSKDLPVARAIVTDLREAAPGIWFPYGARYTAYKEIILRDRGVQEANWTADYVCQDVSLEPSYPRSYFKDVKFPDGTKIYVIENGNIKTSYLKGAGGAPEESVSSRSRARALWAANLVVLLAASFLVVKRRPRSRGQP